MGVRINLGQWNTIFAVPTAVADRHLKLASESQLKVLLYLLRHAGDDCADDTVARAVGISTDEVKNALEFWTERGLLSRLADELTPPAPENSAAASSAAPAATPRKTEEPKKPTVISRAVRPDSAFAARLISEDKNLSGLMEEAQTALKKPLAPGDAAVLVMLYSSFGLPCEVIAMLLNFLAETGRGNMRAVERIGIEWSDSGVNTVEAAEHEIERYAASRDAWGRVSALMGLRNAGHPTAAQLSNADRWVNVWGFSDEMINEAYERCVDTKGTYNISYINAILKKWYEKKLFSMDALKEYEQRQSPSRKKSPKGSVFTTEGASFDMGDFESKSLFDD